MQLEKDKILLINNTFNNKAIFAIERYLDILGYSYHETIWKRDILQRSTAQYLKNEQILQT